MSRHYCLYKNDVVTLVLLLLFCEVSYSESSVQIWERAKTLITEGKVDEAEKVFEDLLINSPNDGNIIMGLGYIKYHKGKMVLKSGDFKKAMDVFGEAKKMFDTSANIGTSEIKSKSHFNKGNCDLVLADFIENSNQPLEGISTSNIYKEAVNSYRKALELNPNFEEAKKNLTEDDGRDWDVRVSTAISILDEITNDPNIPSYTRTQIWNIVTMMEMVKNTNL